MLKTYAIKKEPDIFNIEKLQTLADTVPGGFEIRPIDRQLFRLCMASRQLRDIVSQFDSYEHFSALGLGYAAVADGLPVSGAGSYSRYSSGIEIEVDTLPGYRRKGLARACCAKLILECLDRGLYPSWDAQNTASAALAESLGYHFDREYTVYIESDK